MSSGYQTVKFSLRNRLNASYQYC